MSRAAGPRRGCGARRQCQARGTTTHSLNRWVPAEVIDANNRWWKAERAGNRDHSLAMLQVHTDAGLNIRFSKSFLAQRRSVDFFRRWAPFNEEGRRGKFWKDYWSEGGIARPASGRLRKQSRERFEQRCRVGPKRSLYALTRKKAPKNVKAKPRPNRATMMRRSQRNLRLPSVSPRSGPWQRRRPGKAERGVI